MQRLTNEMNFAESTFVLPAETPGTDIRMRIFTPAREMPMAGHPTVGTTFALAHERRDRAGSRALGVRLEHRPDAGGAELEGRRAATWRGWIRARRHFRPPGTPGRGRCSTPSAPIAPRGRPPGWPVEEASCGAAFFYVPLATRAAVDACEPDGAAMRRLQSAFAGAHVGVFVFSAEPGGDGATVYSRMFAPEAGVVEDPATGSASGPLGGYLVRHGIVPPSPGVDIVSAQGVKMGRPSRLHVRVEALDAGGGHPRARRRAGRAGGRGHVDVVNVTASSRRHLDAVKSLRSLEESAASPDRLRDRAGDISGREALDGPAGAVAAVAQAIVQPVGAALPELHRRRRDDVAAPVRRPRHVAAGNRAAASASRRSSTARPGMTRLCGDAQAPSRLSSGRDAK